MDLGKQFATDRTLELEGTWVDIGEGGRIKVARSQNELHRKVLERLRKPYRSIVMSGRELPTEVVDKITIESIAEAILLDWENISDEGRSLPFTRANSKTMLTKYPDFRDVVAYLASQAETFRKQAVEDAGGNSSASLTGPTDSVVMEASTPTG